MIRIPVTVAQLRARIEAVKPGWERRMKALVAGLKKLADPDFPNEWSEIKQAYIEFQASKCAFCEKPLEGKIEQDVEHFRPKGAVVAWTMPADLVDEIQKAGFRVTPTPKGSKGYKYLAFHPLNYTTACKTCNSIRKQNYFPIAGRRRLGGRDPTALASELPYLIFPLANLDTDPEKLIEFSAVTPRPKAGLTAFDRLRARATIAFFGLDDLDGRKELLIDRFETLEKVYLALKGRTAFATAADRASAAQVVAAYETGRKRHTNCVKHFVALYDRDPQQAERLFRGAVDYLKSVST